MDAQDERIVIKSSLWYTASSILLKGLDFLTIPIFTRLLTKEEFGDYNNFLSWLQLVTIVATLSLSASLIRARFDYEKSLYRYVVSVLLLGTVNTGILFLLTMVNPDFFSGLLSMPYGYLCYMLAYIAVRPALDMFQEIQRFRYHYKLSVAISAITAIVTVVLSLLLIYTWLDRLKARLFGAYLPLFIVSLTCYIYFLARGRRGSFAHCTYALRVCLPYIPHLLAMTMLASTDRVMITRLCGAADTALYSLAYTCSLIAAVLWNAMNTAFSPWLGEKLHEKRFGEIRSMSAGYVAIFAVLVLGVLLASPEILYILGGRSYLAAKYVMPPVMLGCFFQFVYSMYVNVEQFEKKTVGMAIASLAAALLNLGLNFVFIPLFGYIAAAYTTLAGYLFLLVLHYLLVRHIGLAKVYETKKIALLVLAAMAVTAVVNLLYQWNEIRLALLTIYIFVLLYLAIRNRRKLLQLIR